MTTLSYKEILSRNLRPLARQVEAAQIIELETKILSSGIDTTPPNSKVVVDFLVATTRRAIEDLSNLRQSYVDFASAYQNAADSEECGEIVLEFAKRLGGRGVSLREDRRALRRWFGYDAVVERFGRREQIAEQRIGFLIERVGSIASAAMREAPSDRKLRFFRNFQVESLATPLLAHVGDERVRIEAFRCLSRCLTALPPGQETGAVASQLVQFVNRAALDPGQNIWIQSEALALTLHTSPTIFARTVRRRLSEPREGDDLFVRRRAVRLIASQLRGPSALWDCVELILADPSAYVRQELPGSIARGIPEKSIEVIRRLAMDDSSASVRASSLLALPLIAEAGEEITPLRELLEDVFKSEQDSFVLRTGLYIADELQKTLFVIENTSSAETWYHKICPALERLHTQANSFVVRRGAARTRERLWSRADFNRRAALEIIERMRDATPPRKREWVSRNDLGVLSHHTTGRLLAVAAEYDFGLFAEMHHQRIRITRGHRFGFRLWRLLHEFRHPATDKRQAHRHTIGRVFRGGIHAPSAILSELSETTVPGEPLFIEEEDGWRPYLPLVDEVISSLDEGLKAQTLEIYTAEGVTEVTSPRTLVARLRARSVLVRRFLHYARLRNWRADRGGQTNSYVEALRELGIAIRIRPHGDGKERTSPDEAVTRFFEETP